MAYFWVWRKLYAWYFEGHVKPHMCLFLNITKLSFRIKRAQTYYRWISSVQITWAGVCVACLWIRCSSDTVVSSVNRGGVCAGSGLGLLSTCTVNWAVAPSRKLRITSVHLHYLIITLGRLLIQVCVHFWHKIHPKLGDVKNNFDVATVGFATDRW